MTVREISITIKRDLPQKSWQAAACLSCLALLWTYGSGLEGTEFSGGRITGPLLDMSDIGIVLFIPALLVVFLYRRVAAVITLLASLLSLPLYIYFAAPGPFRYIFKGEYSVPAKGNFVWGRQELIGILAITFAIFVSIRSLLLVARAPKNQ